MSATMVEPSDYKPLGWHSRGYLPHFDAGEVFQSITFRLYDSMPQELLVKWREELARESEQVEDKLRWRIEAYLDQGYGACYLSDIRIANMVQNALLHFDGDRYRLSAWIIMPNHVHFWRHRATRILCRILCIRSSLTRLKKQIRSLREKAGSGLRTILIVTFGTPSTLKTPLAILKIIR